MEPWARAHAPVRALDAGGWSDTWFARQGAVCNLALGPGATGTVARAPGRQRHISFHVPAYDDHYSFEPGQCPGRHPLLEAAVQRYATAGCPLDVEVSSAVPAGSSLGTSAAVLVALIAALHALEGRSLAPSDLAHAAHEVETVDLGRQSGVQDQVAAAYGGANLIEVCPYPEFTVTPLDVPPATMAALSRRVITVYLGAAHDSNAVHSAVIRRLESDPGATEVLMAPIRAAAHAAARALAAGDLSSYGRAMTDSTEAQAALHPSLVSPQARMVVGAGTAHGALGYKVNGSGGPGGTVTLLSPEEPGPMLAALGALGGDVKVLELRLALQGAQTEHQVG